MIDIQTEKLVPLAEAPALLPPNPSGRLVHRVTVFRWAREGMRGVKLETISIGGRRCTSAAALQRFFDAISDAAP